MLLNAQTLALAALFSALATGRPLDSSKPREIVPRNKSYSVVNVGGDASTPVPATATSVIKTTKTVEVVGPAQTVTQEVTATVVKPQPVPASTSSCSSSSVLKSSSSSSTPTPVSSTPTPTPTSTSSVKSTSSPSPSVPLPTSTATPTISSLYSSSISTPISTPKPIFVTVTLSPDNGPTEYYDDGMWHTHYRVKTFEAAAAVTAAP
ncbi:hypothetical protein BKA58DRAFT_150632 [Alternaria rosae]|uniref:uncharacterized protein n=1 Tax=Alternaria rosae TaxID=1187941 RepID=UPI001E8E71BA|nr:uncharacterized protein BKA58DRAFT_150632 [Alternaria rosae]KAH6872681.1 hypothetical protein BKA58DRAFT_150632 [Alternaria rosae]